MNRKLLPLVVVLLAGPIPAVRAQEAQPSKVLQAMKAELARSVETLKSQPTPPYFLSYEITEDAVVAVTGSFGKIEESSEDCRRQLDIDLRVGDATLDNTHAFAVNSPASPLPGTSSSSKCPSTTTPTRSGRSSGTTPTGNTKRRSKQLTKVKTNVEVKVEQEDTSADFSRETPEKYVEQIPPLAVDRRAWEEKIRKYTAPFARYGDIYEGQATFTADRETRWYTNSEGSEIQVSQSLLPPLLSASPRRRMAWSCRATRRSTRLDARRPSRRRDRPQGGGQDDSGSAGAAHRAGRRSLHRPGDSFGQGRAVFFHEVFGHRIEGHRQKGGR